MRKQYHARQLGADTWIWDVHRLVRLASTLNARFFPLSGIAELDENWWYDGPEAIPTPRSIAAHMALVSEADLTHPILLCKDGRLMDGMHRVVKAVTEGCETIAAVRFPVTPEPDFVNVPLSELPYPDEDV